MEKYYYDYDSINGNCLEKCAISNCQIGSISCKTDCLNCRNFDEEEGWIECRQIKKATE